MRLLVVLSCALTVAAACIPTKTPQPGIPAVTPAPPAGCTKFPVTSMADCTALGVGVCDQVNLPMVSTTAISCTGGAFVNIVMTIAGAPDLYKSVAKAACSNGVWNDSAGMPLFATPPPAGAVISVICEG